MIRDVHVYGGALLVSLGAAAYLGAGAGLICLGAVCLYLGLRS